MYVKAYRAAAFDGWLADRHDVDDCYRRLAQRYHRSRARQHVRTWRKEVFELRQFFDFLHDRGVARAEPTTARSTPADEFIEQFGGAMRQLRGLSERTICLYSKFARQFLRERFGSRPLTWGELRAGEVTAFVQRQSRRLPPPQVKLVLTALRSMLRHAQMHGEVDARLVHAVPAVSSGACRPALPRAIAPDHARRAVDSCDVATATGRRDRAVLLLLARLGLRAGEVAALTLDDVDWGTGCLRVRGKGRREDPLPLPPDVGEAIAAYLQDGRPASLDRRLFLRSCAPIRGFDLGASAVGSIVGHALARAGIDAPHKGAHQFRHALAVRLLRDGASLPEIGEVLRHRGTQVTAIYARVDLAALRALAPAWPGVAR
ncbi:MAG: site-specific integrase [Comamonadaceae bacterium]|nr:site-specific integrase [Comamonadaceae bacterium]